VPLRTTSMPARCAMLWLAWITHIRSQKPAVSSTFTGSAKIMNPSGNHAARPHRAPPASVSVPHVKSKNPRIEIRVCCTA
jgi:hypothetical protein